MATSVPMKTMNGQASFGVAGGGTPESPYVFQLTTAAPTGSVFLATSAGAGSFGVTGSGTPQDPFLLCAST